MVVISSYFGKSLAASGYFEKVIALFNSLWSAPSSLLSVCAPSRGLVWKMTFPGGPSVYAFWIIFWGRVALFWAPERSTKFMLRLNAQWRIHGGKLC